MKINSETSLKGIRVLEAHFLLNFDSVEEALVI
jgi:hypothetical protein